MKRKKAVTDVAAVAQDMSIKNNKTKVLVKGAVVAAIYAVLTLCLAPISYGPVQFRLSELLTVLPVFAGFSVPGLTIGCVLANLMGGFGLYDIVIGSLATLLGALGTRFLRKKPWLAVWPPVVSNALLVGSMLYFVVPDSPGLLINILSVGISELVICVGLGLPFIWVLKRYSGLFHL